MTLRAAPLVVLIAVVSASCADRTSAPRPEARLVDRGINRAIDPAARETSVTVRVEDEHGAPVEGARLALIAGWSYAIDMPGGGEGFVGADGIAMGLTDAAGRFVASPRLSKDVRCLRAAALRDGRAGLTERKFVEEFGAGRAELLVVLRTGATYEGRVADSAGRPVPDAKVQCHFGDGDFDLECGVAADGSFRCGPVPVGAEKTWVSAVQHGPVRTVWSQDATRPTADRPIVLVVDPVPDIPANRK